MNRTLVGIFDNYSSAENATHKIKDTGLTTNDISIVTKETQTDTSVQAGAINDNISDGVVTGTVLGGVAGVLLGIGTVVMPGLGVIAAAGPIVGLLSGAVTGGVVGGLIDLGIPEDDSQTYENEIKGGKTLLTMKCSEDDIDKISTILRTCGASKVSTH